MPRVKRARIEAEAKQAKKRGGRRDPRRRPNSIVAPGAQLENQQEGFHYVWANPADRNCGLASYLARDYQIQVYERGGVCPLGVQPGEKGGPAFGDQITYQDMVLVACDQETYEESVEYGPYGDTGQAAWDQIEEHLLQKGGDDKLRGMHQLGGVSPRVARFEPEPEHGIG